MTSRPKIGPLLNNNNDSQKTRFRRALFREKKNTFLTEKRSKTGPGTGGNEPRFFLDFDAALQRNLCFSGSRFLAQLFFHMFFGTPPGSHFSAKVDSIERKKKSNCGAIFDRFLMPWNHKNTNFS